MICRNDDITAAVQPLLLPIHRWTPIDWRLLYVDDILLSGIGRLLSLINFCNSIKRCRLGIIFLFSVLSIIYFGNGGRKKFFVNDGDAEDINNDVSFKETKYLDSEQ